MLHSRKLALACFASIALLTTSMFPPLARGAAAVVSSQGGATYGEIHAPSFTSLGDIHGRLIDGTGNPYECQGSLMFNNDSGAPWTGYSPTGTIEGELVPVEVGSLQGLKFWGSYAMKESGEGSFHAYVTAPAASAGEPRVLLGSFSGRFMDPLEIAGSGWPIHGDFRGQWSIQ